MILIRIFLLYINQGITRKLTLPLLLRIIAIVLFILMRLSLTIVNLLTQPAVIINNFMTCKRKKLLLVKHTNLDLSFKLNHHWIVAFNYYI